MPRSILSVKRPLNGSIAIESPKETKRIPNIRLKYFIELLCFRP